MRIIFFLQFFFLLLSWNLYAKAPIRESKTTIVCGKIVNQTNETPKVITILSCDPLTSENRYASRIDSTGEFRAEFEMLWGHSFTINYDKQFINVYADMNDSIHLIIDAKKFHEPKNNALVFSGDNSIRNQEFSRTYNDLIGISNPTFNDFTVPLEDFMKIFKTDNKRINDSIVRYCQKQNISQWTQKLMQDMCLYALANSATDFKGRNKREAVEFFTQPIFDVYNPEKFGNMMFSYHISSYLVSIIRNDSLFTNYSKKQDVLSMEKRGNELLRALPKSLSRDVMLYSFYKKIDGGSFVVEKDDFTSTLPK